jgi:hypothetical protein
MAEGFVLDRSESGRKVSAWVEGAPVRSLWLGLSLRGRRKIEVQTLRCTRCGFLESYAVG